MMDHENTINIPVSISGIEQLKNLTNQLESQVNQVEKTVEKINNLKLKINI